MHFNKRTRRSGGVEFSVIACISCYAHSAKCNYCDFHHQFSGKTQSFVRGKMGNHARQCQNNSRLNEGQEMNKKCDTS